MWSQLENRHEIDHLMANTDPKHVMLVLDTGHINMAGIDQQCHEFLGESTITFNKPPDPSETSHDPASQPFVIPEGLPFKIALTQGIDTATAAAWDSIKAQLITPITLDRKVVVLLGAAITARIVRLRQFFGNTAVITLEIKLETIDIRGVYSRLRAMPDSGGRFLKTQNGSLQRRVELGTTTSLDDRSANIRVPEC
jgi:hypothetical protein